MTQDLIHRIESAAGVLAMAVEPLTNIPTKKATYIRELARTCSIGMCELANSIEGFEDYAIECTIEALEEIINNERDEEDE